MTDRSPYPEVRAFLLAVVAGSLAAAAPALLITVPLGLMMVFDDGHLNGLAIMFAPFVISFPCVLIASLLIGLPLTTVLAWMGRERVEFYVIAGLIIGPVPFLVLMFQADGSSDLAFAAACGAIGGAVTGWVWGRHRDELAAEFLPD